LPQWHTGNPNWREETSLEEIQQAELAIKNIKEDVKHLQENYPDDDRVFEFCKNDNYFFFDCQGNADYLGFYFAGCCNCQDLCDCVRAITNRFGLIFLILWETKDLFV
jgi:hypothetical protein